MGTLNMQRRHFEAIARALLDLKPDRGNQYATASIRIKGAAAYAQWEATVYKLGDVCAVSNVNFQRAKFNAACGLET